MATEGESPIIGALCLVGAGFGLGMMTVFMTLAVTFGAAGLWIGALALAGGSVLSAWVGWREVCEATRFRRAMDAHRVLMLQAGWRP